jgi:hypothetical protein
MVFGCDFNLIRGRGDKNNSNIDWRLVQLFNDFIANNQLQELKRVGSRFTWSNKQRNHVLVNLDRVLMTPDWGQHFPLCKVASLMRIESDHAPIIMDIGEEEVLRGAHFHFERQWILIPSFKKDVIKSMVETALSPMFDSTLDLWQVLMAKLRKFLRGYGTNLRGGGQRRMGELKSRYHRWMKKQRVMS